MSEKLIIAAYNAGYGTRKHEKDYDPMGSSDVCAAISQLDAQSAYIEELSGYLAKIKPVLQTIAIDRGKGSKADVLFNELLALLNQSPAASLEQVKRKVSEEAIYDFTTAIRYEMEGPKNCDSIEDFADQYLANNLNEKG